uniref:hypothetical protein n=1 Tax=Endozoicomonas sp. SESOKO3 TaxID=2828744 RepID=UPI0021478142
MLRAGLSVLSFVFLLLGAFYSQGYDETNKAKIVVDKSGHQKCKQCGLSLDVCNCRCDQCGKRYREKRVIARVRIKKNGQCGISRRNGKEPMPGIVYLSTEKTCQCEEKPLIIKLRWDPRTEPGCSKWNVAFDGASTSQMTLLESSGSGFSNEALPVSVPDAEPDSDSDQDKDSDLDPDLDQDQDQDSDQDSEQDSEQDSDQ